MSSAGIGEGTFIARLAASVSPPGEVTVVPAGQEQAFAAPRSTSFLPVSYNVHRKLALYNLRTIGDVTRLSLGALQAQFGSEGRRLYNLVRGISIEPFRPRARAEPIAGSLTMPAPTVNSAALLIAARQLVGRLLHQPAMHYRQVRQLRLRFLLLDGGSWERTLTFREPIGDDVAHLRSDEADRAAKQAGPVEEPLELIGLTSGDGEAT
jgi:DNA polymerase-4